MKNSPMFRLNWHDLLKGLFVAAGSSVAMLLQESLDKGELTLDWKGIGMAAVGGCLTYLIKNFFTGNQQSLPPVNPN